MWSHPDPVTGTVELDGEAIAVTPDHPFRTERGWLAAGELVAGDRVVSLTGPAGIVGTIRWDRGPDVMWNLTVETAHTYTVGSGAWLVHNDFCNVGGLDRGPDFVVTQAGEAIPVPAGASGPRPVETGLGFEYVGGRGGHGLDSRVSSVRIMDPTLPKHPSPGYPGGYVSYRNAAQPRGQAVHPLTGRTIAMNDPWWHIALRP